MLQCPNTALQHGSDKVLMSEFLLQVSLHLKVGWLVRGSEMIRSSVQSRVEAVLESLPSEATSDELWLRTWIQGEFST